jgi:hypothetical protein
VEYRLPEVNDQQDERAPNAPGTRTLQLTTSGRFWDRSRHIDPP